MRHGGAIDLNGPSPYGLLCLAIGHLVTCRDISKKLNNTSKTDG